MSNDDSNLERLSAALEKDNLAPKMAAAIRTTRAPVALSVLRSLLPGQVNATPDQLVSAVGNVELANLVRQAELIWTNIAIADSALAADGAHETASEAATVSSRLQQAAAQNDTARNLAYVTTFGFFLLIFSLIALDHWPNTQATAGTHDSSAPSQYKDILLTLMGIVGTAWAGIISFFFGSSVGSRQQSQTLQEISRNQAPPHSPAGGGA